MNTAAELQNLELPDLPEEPCLPVDPVESAEIAGLRYVSDSRPGIRRKKTDSGFEYFKESGKPVTDEKTLNRIKGLVIPPAWSDVWICPIETGHLQATGRDAKGRKQFRYHKRWAEVRGQTKYGRMLLFGAALAAIRRRTEKDLALRGLKKDRVLAMVVRLLESSLIRVGNEEYAKENSSFGLTTLRNDHVDVSGSVVCFNFRGKSGKFHSVEINDRRLARIVRRCVELPGQELFQYIDDDGETRAIDSGDVNDYLDEIVGEHFTAKDFRTWGGTIHMARILLELGPASSKTEAKKNIVQAIKKVSSVLGNREATCKKYYIHPAILEAYIDGKLFGEFAGVRNVNGLTSEGLYPDEIAVLRILSEWDADIPDISTG